MLALIIRGNLMLLLVGLGNPGSKYEKNRHNIGFMAVDEIIHRHNFLPGRSRFQAIASEGSLSGQKVLVLKPQTFMNESGRAVSEAMRFYKLEPAQVIVLYDELDVNLGKVKVKIGGGHAGHNGIRSISNHIGPDFTRVRIGIDHPGDKAKVHSHVLGDFAKGEGPLVEKIIEAISYEIPYLVGGDTPRFISEVASAINPPRPHKAKPKDIAKNTDRVKKSSPIKSNDIEGPLADALRGLKDNK